MSQKKAKLSLSIGALSLVLCFALIASVAIGPKTQARPPVCEGNFQTAIEEGMAGDCSGALQDLNNQVTALADQTCANMNANVCNPSLVITEDCHGHPGCIMASGRLLFGCDSEEILY